MPLIPCSANSCRTRFGRLLSCTTTASNPPPPVNRPVRRSVCTAWIRSMPPTVLMYRAMMSSAVCADSGAVQSANPTSLSRTFRMVVPAPSLGSAFPARPHNVRGSSRGVESIDVVPVEHRLHLYAFLQTATAVTILTRGTIALAGFSLLTGAAGAQRGTGGGGGGGGRGGGRSAGRATIRATLALTAGARRGRPRPPFWAAGGPRAHLPEP